MKARSIFTTFLIVAAACAAIGYGLSGSRSGEASASHAAPASDAMPVDVTMLRPEPIQLWKQFSGNVVAVDYAEIRPQVEGRITEIRFTDGQYVNAGDVLVVIDPRPYEAELTRARAALQTAKTEADLAEKEYQRAMELVKKHAISQSLMDERANNRVTAAAAIKGAQAAVAQAEINLDYAYVKAPISGKTSRAELTVGNLAQTGQNAPLLTSIVADERVYVDFEVDEQTYIRGVRESGTAAPESIPVRLQLSAGDGEYQGSIHSFDNRIDPASGTIRARAIFDNTDRLLLPGMSVSVLMGSARDQERLLITERAIGTDQDRKFVYIIGKDGTATYREVSIGDSVEGRRIILSGVEAGDTVITEGMMRIRPGMPVTPKLNQDEASTPIRFGEQGRLPEEGAKE